MTQDVASPLEDRLGAALTEVAEHVSIDQLPAMWFDDGARRVPSRRVRLFAVAALAAALAVGVVFAVNGGRSKSVSQPIPASTSTSTSTNTPTPDALACLPSPPNFLMHQMAGTDATVVPGNPIALLACRYHGLNQPDPAGSLAKSAFFDPATIADALNAQPVIPPNANYLCPIDFGDTIVLLFGYSDNSRLAVRIGTTGCRFASNGDRVVRIDPATLNRLQAVLGKDAPP
ncbi:MAG: hypothetical protein QOI44_2332 [Actinomycetota bacterium]|nr:hypothetical protein [Actinomycetota bacterium]